MIERQRIVYFEEGSFSQLFGQFIKYKQGLGFKYGYSVQAILSKINSKLNSLHTEGPILTRKAVEAIVEKKETEAPATQIKRVCLMRHFANFMLDLGYNAYVYPPHCNVVFHDNFSPYIFTYEQIQAIIKAADSMKYSPYSSKYHLIWPAFIRVLYCCGLRLSEALNLKIKDVDLDAGVLFIEKSKNETSRYVPISLSLNTYLKKYAENIEFENTPAQYFFPAPDNGRYAPGTARERIKKFYKHAGIPTLSNGGYPRVHDLRHSYSCHALAKMQREGFDLYYSLPILSAYLGHQGIRDTEKYLRLPQFQIKSVMDAANPLLEGIIPEVLNYEKE